MPQRTAVSRAADLSGTVLRQNTTMSARSTSRWRTSHSRVMRARIRPALCKRMSGFTTPITVEGTNPGSTAKILGGSTCMPTFLLTLPTGRLSRTDDG